MTDRIDDDDIDYLFTRLTADKLARAMFTKDVRVPPTIAQIAEAQAVLDRTGYLYRMVAGFRVEDWQRKPSLVPPDCEQGDSK